MKKTTILTFCVCLLMALNSSAQTYVSATGDDIANDGSISSPFATIAKALTIEPANGFIIIDGVIEQPVQVIIDKSITIIGVDGNVAINRSSGAAYRLFSSATSSISINFESIKFNGGAFDSFGGAFFCDTDLDVSFTNCSFTDFDNSDADPVTKKNGGAVGLIGVNSATFMNCVFTNNTADWEGGAIWANVTGNVQIEDCLFTGNTSSNLGGAIATWQGVKLNIKGSTFYQNASVLYGGAIWSAGTNTTSGFENITVFQNSLTSGGNPSHGGGCRVSADSRPFYVKNSLFYANLYNTDGTPGASDMVLANPLAATVINTLSGNTVPTPVNGVNGDVVTLSNLFADLTSSNLAFNPVSGFVEYGIPGSGDATPIDFGSDGNDAGAWDSTFVLSASNVEIEESFTVFNNSQRQIIEVNNKLNKQVALDIYNVIGKKVFSLEKVNQKVLINSSRFQSGIYIAVVKIDGSFGAKKFIIN